MQIINVLVSKLNGPGFRHNNSEEVADIVVVRTAINQAEISSDSTLLVVGQDVDLLVLI